MPSCASSNAWPPAKCHAAETSAPMTALPAPALAFVERLPLHERNWLGQLGARTASVASTGWVHWQAGPHTLGCMPPERAHALAAQLPHCHWRSDTRLHWDVMDVDAATRSALLQHALEQARRAGQLPGWRNETFAWWPEPAIPPSPAAAAFLQVERAGFRHLGLMSHAVHIHGFLPDGDLWCGRRSPDKATDPGRLDNLAAGGLPVGETALQTALRELHEEAGLHIAAPRLQWAGAIRCRQALSAGWHDERLLVFNLALTEAETPRNLDGEVDLFLRLSPGECLQRMRQGEFTLDACLALACGLGLTPASASH